jgi:hypothetical protein
MFGHNSYHSWEPTGEDIIVLFNYDSSINLIVFTSLRQGKTFVLTIED